MSSTVVLPTVLALVYFNTTKASLVNMLTTFKELTEAIESMDGGEPQTDLQKAVSCYEDVVSDFLQYDDSTLHCFMSSGNTCFYCGSQDHQDQLIDHINEFLNVGTPIPNDIE